ncbi:helix-turn-helix transcriptional regulator [Heyndrickxia coagulans]|uniref:helix-turn-helix transcriptional regulator n=1 Tax=Heyndrickxia coagulans TaxID=1398 RepID=UPI0023E45D0D|nr:helix-turn-helix transcriptional regulator [Heyndrickxia coagulans]
MPKVKLPYEVKNNLNYYITRELGEKMARTGIKYYKENVMEDVAKYSGVGVGNIKRINRNIAQPSLGVALKIAEYFNVKVEDVFKIS